MLKKIINKIKKINTITSDDLKEAKQIKVSGLTTSVKLINIKSKKVYTLSNAGDTRINYSNYYSTPFYIKEKGKSNKDATIVYFNDIIRLISSGKYIAKGGVWEITK